jgi:predicted alpha/beta-hydrolase family hydrolase
MSAPSQELSFEASRSSGSVSALLDLPDDAEALFLLAHGAGAGMRHPFLEEIAERLSRRRIATLRYQFPYLEQGRRRPDPPALAQATVRSAVAAAARLCDLPIIAGGKSWGGRMTAYAAAAQPLPGVRGLAFLGFPLHPPTRPGSERWQPMSGVTVPMLFLQGDRDKLADLGLLRPLVSALAQPSCLHVVEGGDHSFAVLKRSGRTAEQVFDELAGHLAEWSRWCTGHA